MAVPIEWRASLMPDVDQSRSASRSRRIGARPSMTR